MQQSRMGLQGKVVGADLREFAGRAIGRKSAVNQTRVGLTHRLVPEPELLHRPNAVIVQQHVRPVDKKPSSLASRIALEIDRD